MTSIWNRIRLFGAAVIGRVLVQVRSRAREKFADEVRPARLELQWTAEEGRETRLYVPDEAGLTMAVDEIFAQRDGGLWRRVRWVERPDRRY